MNINHVAYMFQVRPETGPYRRGTGSEHNQKCPYVSEIYRDHTQGKMRHLKPVCITEMDIISSSVTTEKIAPFFISGRYFLAGLRPFYTAPSRLKAICSLWSYNYMVQLYFHVRTHLHVRTCTYMYVP